MSRRLFFLFSAVFLCLKAATTFACSCMQQPAEVKDAVTRAYNDATSVVLAKVSAEGPIAASQTYKQEMLYEDDPNLHIELRRTEFIALRSWKGTHGKRFYTRINTECCLCGISFSVSETYLLYLYGPDKEGYYSTSMCTRTTRESEAEEDIRHLGCF